MVSRRTFLAGSGAVTAGGFGVFQALPAAAADNAANAPAGATRLLPALLLKRLRGLTGKRVA